MSTRQKILYIDDDEINVELFEINFSGEFDVISGYSGAQGLKLINENPDIDIVISDMRMPGMNGLEFIREVKKLASDKKCYLLTGYAVNEEIAAAINDGLVIQCFTKPFKLEEIIKVITGS